MYTNETLHYGIPKPLGTDLTVPQDYNEAADAVDEALFNASTNATEAVNAANNAVEAAAEAVEEVGDLGTEVNSLKGRTSALEATEIIQNNKIDNLENQGVTKFDSAGIADPYVNGLTYSVGNVVTYNGQRYKCTTAVVAGEPFDADKWTAEDVETVINQIKSDLAELTDGFEVSIAADTTFTNAIQAIKANPSYDANKFTSESTITISDTVYHRAVNNEFCATLFYGATSVFIISLMFDSNTANQCSINAGGNTITDVSSTTLVAQNIKIKY